MVDAELVDIRHFDLDRAIFVARQHRNPNLGEADVSMGQATKLILSCPKEIEGQPFGATTQNKTHTLDNSF